MAEPRRLLERTGLGASLLKAGSRERPKQEAVRRATLALGASAIAASASAASAGSSLEMIKRLFVPSLLKAGVSTPFWVVGKWVGLGFLTGALAFTTVSAVVPSSSHVGPAVAPTRTTHAVPVPHALPTTPMPLPTAAEREATRSADAGAANPPSVSEPSSSATQRHVAAVGAPDTPAMAAQRPEPQPAPAKIGTASPQSSIGQAPSADTAQAFGAEVAFVDRQWRSLQSGNDAGALAVLRTYEAQFPDLRLHPEVLFLRMQAENQLGNTESAAAHARQIISTYPNSAQAARARAILTALAH
jgi:hypothetical protein